MIKNGWRQATEYTQAGFSTSLFIDPVIQYGNPVSNEKLEANEQVLIHLGPEKGMVHLVLPDGIEKATYTLHSAQGKSVGKRRDHGQASYTPFT